VNYRSLEKMDRITTKREKGTVRLPFLTLSPILRKSPGARIGKLERLYSYPYDA
jgi:hypothetical protein